MRVSIETIDHGDQRYDTCGDWTWDRGALRIYISETGNENYNFLIGIHEMIEAYLCAINGIPEQDVTDFDMVFAGDGEPGDSPDAPYHDQHMQASEVEFKLAPVLGVEWDKYEAAIGGLGG